jgi:FtsH-binding integral membrane protein
MEYRSPFGNQPEATTASQAATYDAGLRAYFLKIYNLMASALAVTGITALFTANSPALLTAFYAVNDSGHVVGMSGLGWIVALSPIGLALWMSMGINRMTTATAQALFWAFAVVMGLSLSSVFLMYTGQSIARTFFITAGTFGAMSLYGYTTKKDLTGMGSFMIMGLWGLIIASLVNIFLQSTGLQFALSVLGVFIFIGLIAYDTQKLKALYYQVGSSDMAGKVAILGALNLYMDFINLFLNLLRFMGDRR